MGLNINFVTKRNMNICQACDMLRASLDQHHTQAKNQSKILTFGVSPISFKAIIISVLFKVIFKSI
jgi:hypothetical protein